MRGTPVRSIFRAPQLGRSSQIVAFVLILALVGAMGLEPTRRLFEQRRRIAEVRADLDRVRGANHNLGRLVERLNDPDFIEQRARAQVGLVYAGETAYAVVPPSRKALRKRRAAWQRSHKPPPPPPAEPGFVEGLLDFVGLS